MAGPRRTASPRRVDAKPRIRASSSKKPAPGGDATSEVVALLEMLHERARAALEEDRAGLLDALVKLGRVRTQVLFRQVRRDVAGGEALARSSQRSQDAVSQLIGPALDGKAQALASIRSELKSQEKADRLALKKLQAAGADFDTMWAAMRVYVG